MWKRPLLAVGLLLLAGLAPSLHAQQVLRLGTNVWPGYEPLYLAAKRESWDSRLHVRLVEYPSATEVLRAFRNRALEAAALTLDEVLALKEAELPLKVVTILDISDGGDVILARPELAAFGDLAGHRIGVESGALGAYFVSRALEVNGMTLDDVEIVHMDVSAHESGYLANEVDAVVTFEPVRTRLRAQGARELFSSAQIPGEIVDVLAVHDDVLERRGDTVRRLIEGWFLALEYMREEPSAAAGFTAGRLRITPEEVISSYQGLHLPDLATNRRLLSGGLMPAVERLHDVLLQERLLSGPVEFRDLLSARWLPE